MYRPRPLQSGNKTSPTIDPKRFCFRSKEEEEKMLDDYKTENIETNSTDVEKQQEMILINKLQSQGKNPPKSQSTFLQKKLQQRKFFDSGDYAMNQDKEKKHQRPSAIPAALGGGKKAPIPESAKQPTSVLKE
uniref:cAMP-regulated phosphoprotein 19 n=1 Tax=Panagrolaimus sp. ES5 TaxID=591445 RepID=A0AC34F4Y6_9BILA